MGGKTRCPNCGHPIDEFALACKYCGCSFYTERRSGQRTGQSQRLNQQQYTRTVQPDAESTYRVYPASSIYREQPERRQSSAMDMGVAVGIALMAGILVLQIVQLIVLLVR